MKPSISPLTSLLVIVLAAILTVPLSGQRPGIRLATIVPTGSSWHKAILEMTDRWRTATDGRINTTVYTNGVLGSEPAVVRSLRNGSLDVAFVTSSGLSQVDDGFLVFGIPFFFEDEAEQIAVQEKLLPVLDRRLEALGFRFLAWGDGGWVQVFSKKPLLTLSDLKVARMFSNGDTRAIQLFQARGFHPISYDQSALVQLALNGLDAVPTTPYSALINGLYRDTRYMLNMRLSPLAGGLVMSNAAWARVSVGDRAAVITGAKEFERSLQLQAPGLDASSVAAMVKRGLVVTTPTPTAMTEFRAEGTAFAEVMRGSVIPAEILDLARRERDQYRKSKGR